MFVFLILISYILFRAERTEVGPLPKVANLYQSPLYVILVLVAALFVLEAFIMTILFSFLSPPSKWSEAVLDSTLLVMLTVPVIYFFLGRPLMMYISEQKRIEEAQEVLNELLELSLKDVPLEELLEDAIDLLVSIPWLVLEKKGSIFLVEDDPEVLVLKAQRGLHESLLSTCELVPFGRCLCGRAAATKKIVFTNHLDERHENTYDGMVQHGHYCIPILFGKQVLGVINLYLKEATLHNETEVAFLNAVANTMAGIIERRKAEMEVTKYAGEVEQSNRLKNLFTDILRHDLLNPTGVIRNIAEIMEDDENLKDSNEIAVLKRNVNKHEDIISNASNYAKLESTEELEKDEIDLAELIGNVINDFDTYAKEKNMNVEFKPGAKHIIKASGAIESVFANILSNAIKYSPPGTDIKIKIEDDDNSKKISFADQGEGISDNHKRAVFDRFVRKDKTGVRGTGLGLAIVKRIVELHDGTVWVEDNPEGKGSIFIVELPK
jgi:signal transduction histidine kinase